LNILRRWHRHHVFSHFYGQVTTSTSTSLVITNDDGTSHTFVVNSVTRFANVSNPVAVGTKVLVIGEHFEDQWYARVVAARKTGTTTTPTTTVTLTVTLPPTTTANPSTGSAQ
jgi:hypothetical protein